MKLTGKVLVVTDAGSGIGRAVALEAVRRAGRVAAVDLNATTLEETAALAAADGAVSTHVLNIMDQAAVEALPAQVKRSWVSSMDSCSRDIADKMKDLLGR